MIDARLPSLRRRDFLKLAALAAASAGSGLSLFHFRKEAAAALTPGGAAWRPERLGSWEDLYRQRWTWDRVAKGSHGWLNCRSACEWDLYVRDGVVVREEQTATYAASEPGVPDFNPRGCQKGACYPEVMYGPSRLTVPLKRVGERGGGQWQQISWDQALREIGEKLVDLAEQHGTETIVHDLGPHFDQGPTTGGRGRFFNLFGAAMNDDWAEIGDLNVGATLTFGFPHIGGSSDEWFLSDYLVVWMMNPSVTQMADAHFLYEARYNGAALTVVDPTYSATAVHADHWLPIRPGSDAALGLAVARHIWDSGRVDLPYVREQTDLPLLVRLDTGRFLRESDLQEGGRAEVLFFWDPASDRPVPAPGSSGWEAEPRLTLNGLEPPIEGRFSVTLRDGTTAAVVPVGALLREHLEPWTIEHAAEVTGLAPEQIARFADGFARAERPMVLSSWGSNRFLHSDQMNRAKILCLALRGAIGRKGAGFHSTGWVGMEGFDALMASPGHLGWRSYLALFEIAGPTVLFDLGIDLVRGRKSQREFEWELGKEVEKAESCMTNTASFNLGWQGVRDDLVAEEKPLYPRTLDDYDRESRAKGWMPRVPRDTQPRAWITGGNNVLRRTNLPQRMMTTMWPQLELIVDINPKLTFTGMHADYLLPAAGYYEKPGIKYPIAYIPYLHYCDAAVPPLGEAKNEWEIYWRLSQEVERAARARNLPPLDACGKRAVDLQQIHARYSFHGEFGPDDAPRVAQFILDNSSSTTGMTVAGLRETGVARYTSAGGVGGQPQLFNDDWKGDGVLRALTHFTEHKWRWPTLTGRQQFYIDHPWFLQAGESLPSHIESPDAGGDYPFQLLSCHARWSVHSVWRDDPMMLRLQRGEPALYVAAEDARARGISDWDRVEVWNDIGRFRVRVKVSPALRPGQVVMYHAWEDYQFEGGIGHRNVLATPLNPLGLVGGYPYLDPTFGIRHPGMNDRDTRVDIRKV